MNLKVTYLCHGLDIITYLDLPNHTGLQADLTAKNSTQNLVANSSSELVKTLSSGNQGTNQMQPS